MPRCKYCAEPFSCGKGANSQYCSNKCREEMRQSMKSKCICKRCGNEFWSLQPKAELCSDRCKKEEYKANSLSYKNTTDYIIFQRDNFKCVYCGKSSLEDGVKLEVEHIYPVSKGGESELFNLATACDKCNGQKSTNVMTDENILRFWEEICKRNEESGIEKYELLKVSLDIRHKNRLKKILR